MTTKIRNIGPHMTEFENEHVVVLISYETPVAFVNKHNGQRWKTDQHFSNTTTRHLSKWQPNYNGTVPQARIQAVLDGAKP